MATFRCSAGLVLMLGLACSSQSAQEQNAPVAVEQAPIARDTIDHVVPKRDFVGPHPARFEWTAVTGVDEYVITIENEVDMLILEARTRHTWLEWPKGPALDPGTYFWRVAGVNHGRRIADSGRAAFVVTRDPD